MLNIISYSEKISEVEYGAGHPFKPRRARIFFELMNRYGLFDARKDKIVEPEPLDERMLFVFHEREYIEILKRAEKHYELEMYKRGIGTEDNPVFKGLYEFSVLSLSATHLCAERIIQRKARFAFNPIGGFHHAGKDHAFGFCYLNDVAVVGKHLLRRGKRFVVIDIDAHHGNGIQDAFYEDDGALVVSIHESGVTLFPGTGSEQEIGTGRGYGYNVNIPLSAGSDDEVYLFAFEAIIPPLIASFEPDMVFVLIGGDAHKDDPFSHLNLTISGYTKVIRIIKSLTERVVALGAGGYNIYKTAALWSLAWAIFCERKIEDQYAGIVGGMMYGSETDLFTLMEETYKAKKNEKSICMKRAEDVVKFLKRHVFPVHGIRG